MFSPTVYKTEGIRYWVKGQLRKTCPKLIIMKNLKLHNPNSKIVCL